MAISLNELGTKLKAELAPVYLICGDEPYQFGEAARLVREAARRAGFDEREILDAEGAFQWGALAAAAEAMSLFSSRRLIELRVAAGKIGKEGSEAIRVYCERPCPDTLLLILAPGMDRKELQSAWAKRIASIGAVIQVWPMKERELEGWLEQRLCAVGLQPGPGVAALLAERSEGNLLAAVQEVEKLRLLHDPGPLELDDLLGNLADSARFDLFALTDAALKGDRARVQRVLTVLRAEGTADVLVLWVLARELRMLAEAADAVARRTSLEAIYAKHRVPRMRQETIERALRRLSTGQLRELLWQCAGVDRAIKGVDPGDPWHRLARIADGLSGGPLSGFGSP
ncbi:DNA polymerase III subunit delta [Thermochromatium tepidum]|jgi:DNA polymerase III, delta subunit|uniref:DNA polymerase III subunit delta n=1 Tax=Thermochromatium tepidum ATCC 43061 TaxID=316276 RepID=A0A6I6E8J5_THETI|nr:DNA polymerase III subunit delta [Thermochromatium tepidum]QGU32983.1 DNA polymerase III subunit delta [Thermochromatium tepidum ATCC 43061]